MDPAAGLRVMFYRIHLVAWILWGGGVHSNKKRFPVPTDHICWQDISRSILIETELPSGTRIQRCYARPRGMSCRRARKPSSTYLYCGRHLQQLLLPKLQLFLEVDRLHFLQNKYCSMSRYIDCQVDEHFPAWINAIIIAA